jgi:histidine decarboxylase
MPCGVVVVKESLCARLTRTGVYTGSPDTTITCSRSGHAALLIWYALRSCGIEGLRTRAEGSRKLAAYTYQRLADLGWEASYNPLGFTVVLDTPPPAVTRKWALASNGGRSHVICMPGLARQQIDDFVADLEAAMVPAVVEAKRQPARKNGANPRLRATPATA